MTAASLFPDAGAAEESAVFTDEQYDARLETLAKLIETRAKTVEEAAQIVRDSKTVSEDTKRTKNETSVQTGIGRLNGGNYDIHRNRKAD